MPAPTDSVEIPAIPTSVVTAAGTDIFPVSQGGVTKQETLAQALTYIQGAIAVPLAQISDASANGRSLVAAANYAAMLTLLSAAPLASPTFTGVPAAPTAAPGTNTTQLATTAFVLANAGVGSVTAVTASAPLASSGGATPDISLTGTVAAARGGTGVSNAGTITNASNTAITGGGTLALGGFTLTVPATGSAALLATANVFSAAQAITVADAATNTVTDLATLTHNSSGTPAASFGSRILFNLDSATVDDRNAAAIVVTWSTATDASRTSVIALQAVSAAGALTTIFSVSGNQAIFAGTLRAVTNNGAEMRPDAGSAAIPVYAFSADNDTGMTRIGANVLGFSTNGVQKINIGSDGATWIRGDDAGTNTVLNVLTIGHNTSGTPAAGYGTGLTFQGESTTTVDTTMADEQVSWVVATHASRTARRVFNIYDTAAREAMRMEASGAAAMIGVLGAAAVIRQTGGENLTNSVASGGVDGTIANYTDLTIYANDAAAIRNDIYQLARMLKQDHDALRLYGFLT